MTSSGKVRIYELSKDLGLDNKDVLDAAEKLSIAAKSHSSSISEAEAGKIRGLLKKGSQPAAPAKAPAGKAILSVKKADAPAAAAPKAPAKPVASAPAKPAPATPQPAPARPAAASQSAKPAAPSAPKSRLCARQHPVRL